MSWYQRKRDELGMFILREYTSTLEECFQSAVEGAIYADLIDRLRVEGAIRPAVVDASALVHTAWDLGSPLNTVVTYFQIIGAEIRVVDCDSDLDLTPVQRVAYMLNKGYLFGSHFLPHDALAKQKSGKTFLNELNEVGLRNCKPVPRTHDIWVGINRLRQILPRFSFRIPACERLLEALSNYHTVRASASTDFLLAEPQVSPVSHCLFEGSATIFLLCSSLRSIEWRSASFRLSASGGTSKRTSSRKSREPLLLHDWSGPFTAQKAFE